MLVCASACGRQGPVRDLAVLKLVLPDLYSISMSIVVCKEYV